MKTYTKAAFVKTDSSLTSLRHSDPLQFSVLFNNWRRMKEEREHLKAEYLRTQARIDFNG